METNFISPNFIPLRIANIEQTNSHVILMFDLLYQYLYSEMSLQLTPQRVCFILIPSPQNASTSGGTVFCMSCEYHRQFVQVF